MKVQRAIADLSTYLIGEDGRYATRVAELGGRYSILLNNQLRRRAM